MDDYEWLKLRILQYLLFKGDLLKQMAEQSTSKLRKSKNVSADDYVCIYRTLLKHELFEEIYTEIVGLL